MKERIEDRRKTAIAREQTEKEIDAIGAISGSAQEQYVKMLAKTLDGVQKMRVAAGNRIAAFKKNHGEDYGDVVDALRRRIWDQADLMEKNIADDLGRAVAKLDIIKWLDQVYGIGPRLSGALVGMLAPIGRHTTISTMWSYTGYGVIEVCDECVQLYFDEAYEDKDKERFLSRQTKRRWETYTTSVQFEAKVDRIGDDPAVLDPWLEQYEREYRAEKYEESEKHLCSCESPDVRGSAPNRKYYTGLILPYDPFLKALLYRVCDQFVRQGKFYRERYEAYKLKHESKSKSLHLTVGHINNRARRDTIKLFLSHLWEMWRKAEGLPTGTFYLKERLGEEFSKAHTLIEPPYADTYDKK